MGCLSGKLSNKYSVIPLINGMGHFVGDCRRWQERTINSDMPDFLSGCCGGITTLSLFNHLKQHDCSLFLTFIIMLRAGNSVFGAYFQS